MSTRGRQSAFTLIELLVVITIVAVLAGLLMPAIVAAQRRSRIAHTKSFIQQCELAAQQFFNDHGDYPPTTWEEVDDFFDYDEIGFDDDPWTQDPRQSNEGIEVFLACVATEDGGAYLEPDDDSLGNTDGDTDDGDDEGDTVAEATSWYFNTSQIFEVVDYWGNPLVYFHNRDYADYDGWDEDNTWWDTAESMTYTDVEGNTGPCYARSARDTTTGNWPNLSGFQLYSWGIDRMPGRGYEDDSGDESDNLIYPGWTAGEGTTGGQLGDEEIDQWVPGDGNIVNWEE